MLVWYFRGRSQYYILHLAVHIASKYLLHPFQIRRISTTEDGTAEIIGTLVEDSFTRCGREDLEYIILKCIVKLRLKASKFLVLSGWVSAPARLSDGQNYQSR